MTTTIQPLLAIEHLNVRFRTGKTETVEAVRDVSFSIAENETVALVGESGSGKSVTAMSILQLLPPNAVIAPESRVAFRGTDLLGLSRDALRAMRGADIGVVFQDPMSSLNPVFTIGSQIAESLRLHRGLTRRQSFARAVELLAEVGIPEPKARIDAFPHQLSGGQQQRVMIAIAIACEPKLLIADEPTTALDVTVQQQILDLLARLKERHRMSMLFISHDLGVVGQIAERVIVMQSGLIREEGPTGRIFTAPTDLYTRALLSCRPTLEARSRRLPVISDFTEGSPISEAPRERGVLVEGQAPLLVVRHLKKQYRLKTGLFARKVIDAVVDASFTLSPGRTLGVVGESGSGKTTVGMMLMRLTEATSGEVLFDGKDFLALDQRALRAYRRRVQIVFQNPYASLNPRFTVAQILIEPMRIHAIGANDDERFRKALALIERVGLPATAVHKYPHEFSGGQRQRIAIARCLTMQPEVLICDESVSALDVSVQAQVLNLLLDLQEEFRLAYVFISHDLAVVKYMADEIMVMSKGNVVEIADSETIYRNPQDPYTQRLLSSIPRGYEAAKPPIAA
jgi:peptide/nickel transport system ATP-binding protein